MDSLASHWPEDAHSLSFPFLSNTFFTIITYNKCSNSPTASVALDRFAGPRSRGSLTLSKKMRVKQALVRLADGVSGHLLYSNVL